MTRKSSTSAVREAWRAEHDQCMYPGCSRRWALECHEILGGTANRPKSIKLTATLLMLCREHHSLFSSCPPPEQLIMELAIKKFCDEDFHDPETVIKIWRPKAQDSYIKEIIEAVDLEHERLVKEFGNEQ